MTASERIRQRRRAAIEAQRRAKILALASDLYDLFIQEADAAYDGPETQEAYGAIEYGFDHLDTAISLLGIRPDE